MKLPKRKKSDDCAEVACDNEQYPYGLKINLDKEQLKQLGITELPKVGVEYILVGVGPVSDVRQSDGRRGVDRSLSIQLQKIEVGPVKTGAIKNAVDAVSAGIKQADGD